MQRLRRALIRYSRLAGPTLGAAIVVCIGGLGLHADRDWHRHGELGAGFFHHHFHLGDHDHEHAGLGHLHHDHPIPDNNHIPADGQRKRTAVLTIAQALHDLASVTPVIVAPETTSDQTPIEHSVPSFVAQLPNSANSRAPPV